MAQQAPEAFDRSIRTLRRSEVEQRCQLSRSSIYRLISLSRFPKPITISGGRGVRWIEAEIDSYLRDCIAQRDQRAA